mgnify:CR=1 FL=1
MSSLAQPKHADGVENNGLAEGMFRLPPSPGSDELTYVALAVVIARHFERDVDLNPAGSVALSHPVHLLAMLVSAFEMCREKGNCHEQLLCLSHAPLTEEDAVRAVKDLLVTMWFDRTLVAGMDNKVAVMHFYRSILDADRVLLGHSNHLDA